MDVVDVSLSVLLFLSFAIGFPANLVSFNFFLNKAKRVPNCIYLVMSAADGLTTLLLVPVGISLAKGRESGSPFTNRYFCNIWGVVYEFVPFYTVFLVACLSFLRTLVLIRPLTIVKQKPVLVVMAGYAVFVFARLVVGMNFGLGEYQYSVNSGYCWNHVTDETYQVIHTVFSVGQLAFPILPITLSCITSVLILMFSSKKNRGVRTAAGTRVKHKATVTIILVTMLYIVFNIPLFANYTRYVVNVYRRSHGYLLPEVQNRYLERYTWLVAYIVTMSLNSLANPLVYFWRMRQFRVAVMSKLLPVRIKPSGSERSSGATTGVTGGSIMNGAVVANNAALESST